MSMITAITMALWNLGSRFNVVGADLNIDFRSSLPNIVTTLTNRTTTELKSQEPWCTKTRAVGTITVTIAYDTTTAILHDTKHNYQDEPL